MMKRVRKSGKRLKAILPNIIPKLKSFKEFIFEKEVEEKLLKISAATIDRILSPEKKKFSLKNRSKTKPGTLIKKQIPVRVFNEWDEGRPGFMEVDLSPTYSGFSKRRISYFKGKSMWEGKGALQRDKEIPEKT